MGRKVRDLAGIQINELLFIEPDPESPRGAGKEIRWICECSCGVLTSILPNNVFKGHNQSCGHLRGKWRKHPDSKKAAAARATKWNLENKSRRKEIQAKYAKKNPHLSAHKEGIRRSRKHSQRCTCCSDDELKTMYEIRPAGCHIDHIIPLAKGGPHCLSNLQFLPAAMNLSKGARMLEGVLR